MLHHEIAVIVD